MAILLSGLGIPLIAFLVVSGRWRGLRDAIYDRTAGSGYDHKPEWRRRS